MEGGGFECEKGLEHLSSGSESDSSMLILARLDAETKRDFYTIQFKNMFNYN